MRLSSNHVDYLAFLVYKAFKSNPNVMINNPDAIVSAVRTQLLENLRLEDQLEVEAAEILSKHRQEILGKDSDYQKMLREGVKILARKKGVVI